MHECVRVCGLIIIILIFCLSTKKPLSPPLALAVSALFVQQQLNPSTSPPLIKAGLFISSMSVLISR